jgi:S1-C subfamily serine protease
MSRALKYVLTSTAVVALVVIGLLVYAVVTGPSPDDAVGATPAAMTATPAPIVSGMPGAASGAPAGAFSPAAIFQKSAPGVVLVQSTFGGGGGFGGQAIGSGFVVSTDGTILTNAHVVSENGARASSVTVAFRQGTDQTSGDIKAEVLGIDQTSDVAVLRIDPTGRQLTPLPLGDSNRVAIGQWVVAIGNPLGYDFSLTQGIVSGLGRDLRAPNGAIIPNGIQTDAAINQGNSGGPLLDQNGNVIGINEQIATTSGSFSGLGFAIPIDTAKTVMQQITTTGRATHAFLGIRGMSIDQPLAKALGMAVEQGVLVVAVTPGSAAAKAGIKGGDRTTTIQGMPIRTGGDVITRLDGQPLTGMEELAGTIAGKQPGDHVTLTVVSGGSTRDVTVTLGNRP